MGCSGYGWADNSVGVGGCCGGVLRAVGPEGLLWSAGSVGVQLVLGGASFARRSGPISGCGWGLAARGAYSARGFGFILFVMRWIIPLCLILTEFFPPFSARVETSAQKPLI